MRPQKLADVLGQDHLLEPGSPLRGLAQSTSGFSGARSSVILWGPPGTGKTTIARAVALESNMKIAELSAINAGVKEVRDVIGKAQDDRLTYGRETLLFLDEIHRFSKAQQDSLLPAVEAGWVTLVAATTENPSFAVVSPLLSRSLVLKLNELSIENIVSLVNRAVYDPRGFAGSVALEAGVSDSIASLSTGDARRALTILEASVNSARANRSATDLESKILVSLADVEASQQQAIPRYDRDGDMHYDVISAFIKSIRGSDVDAALHWLARMIEAGEDPRFIARRLIILASEDIGLADPNAITLAVSCATAVSLIGMPEGRIPLSEATIYLALAPKSNSAYLAIGSAIEDVRAGMVSQVPSPLRSRDIVENQPTGKAKNYIYPHDLPQAVARQDYLDSNLQPREYFRAKSIGFETDLAQRWNKLREIIRGVRKN
jgi:putative ATPase